jgi:antitoxin component YwqK of YwqJK toxin-antitoxin module
LEANEKDGKYDGLSIYYNRDGTENSRHNFKDGELVFD